MLCYINNVMKQCKIKRVIKVNVEKGNLHINEKQQCSGGDFGDVSISGAGHLTQNINCHSFKTSGSAVVDGKVTCESFYVSGRVQVNGALHCLGEAKVSGKATITQKVSSQSMRVSGSLTTEKELEVKELQVSGSMKAVELNAEQVKVSGSTTINDSMTVQELGVSGWLRVGKTIEAEQMKVSGRLNCEGFINGEEIELEAMSGSSFAEIGASKIKISRYQSGHPINQVISSIIQTVAGPFSPIRKINGNQIEADDIYVEYAKIKKICGHHIVIGPECEIEEIEYSGTLTIDQTSRVKYQVKR